MFHTRGSWSLASGHPRFRSYLFSKSPSFLGRPRITSRAELFLLCTSICMLADGSQTVSSNICGEHLCKPSNQTQVLSPSRKPSQGPKLRIRQTYTTSQSKDLYNLCIEKPSVLIMVEVGPSENVETTGAATTPDLNEGV